MSIRFLAILVGMVAVVLTLFPIQRRSFVEQTGRELDLAIVGRGYFRISDEVTEGFQYTRCGSFEIDSNGQLICRVRGKAYFLDPIITFPNSWDRIAITPDGACEYYSNQIGWTQVGQIELANFIATPAFQTPLDANSINVNSGVESISTPLTDGLGSIQQGWLEKQPETISQYGMRFLIAIFGTLVFQRKLLDKGASSIEPHGR